MFLNSWTVECRTGKDPETRVLDGGKAVTKVSAAIYNGRDKEALWVKLEGWGKVQECLAETKKGDSIVVSGTLKEDSWKGTDGVENKGLVLNVEAFSWGAKPVRATPTTENVPW